MRCKIATAGSAALAKKGYVTAIDALLATGWLHPDKVDDWRRGRVPYLEQATVASLPKISTAMRIFRDWAKSAGLRPSETVYVSWTRDRRQLRFSKSANANIERAYRTHWLPRKAKVRAWTTGDDLIIDLASDDETDDKWVDDRNLSEQLNEVEGTHEEILTTRHGHPAGVPGRHPY